MRRVFYPDWLGGRAAVGLLLLRVVMGTAFVFHGWSKIQNPLHWMDMKGDSGVPGALQALAALSEFGGGIALVLGLLTPLAALGIAGTMGGAIGLVHLRMHHPFVASSPGPSYELAAVYLAAAILLLLVGPGKLSLDALLFGSPSQGAGNNAMTGGLASPR